MWVGPISLNVKRSKNQQEQRACQPSTVGRMNSGPISRILRRMVAISLRHDLLVEGPDGPDIQWIRRAIPLIDAVNGVHVPVVIHDGFPDPPDALSCTPAPRFHSPSPCMSLYVFWSKMSFRSEPSYETT